jgi:hypothetical protein
MEKIMTYLILIRQVCEPIADLLKIMTLVKRMVRSLWFGSGKLT